jgi:hypothetical protein
MCMMVFAASDEWLQDVIGTASGELRGKGTDDSLTEG